MIIKLKYMWALLKNYALTAPIIERKRKLNRDRGRLVQELNRLTADQHATAQQIANRTKKIAAIDAKIVQCSKTLEGIMNED